MKRVLSLLLVVVMLCVMIPTSSLTASAAELRYVNVVESYIQGYDFSSLSSYKKDYCRGMLYDIDNNGQKELILHNHCGSTWDIDIWTLKKGEAYAVTQFSEYADVAPVLHIATYNGKRYLVNNYAMSGSIGGGVFWDFYLVSDSSYFKEFTLTRQDYWYDSSVHEYYIDGSEVTAASFNKRLANCKPFFNAATQGKRWDQLLTDLKKSDVSSSAWYYDAVQYVLNKGYMTGYASGNFGPADSLQRQDFVVTLARIAGVNLNSYKGQNGGMKDVGKNAYYAPAVSWAVNKGIITGYNSGKFGVGDTINREQVCTILWRYMGSPSVSNQNAVLAQFPDSHRISPFAKTACAWAVQKGVISGLSSGKFSPASGASRAQIATILMRMDQKGMF